MKGRIGLIGRIRRIVGWLRLAPRETKPVVVFMNLPDLGGKMLWNDVVFALRDKSNASVRALHQLLIYQMSRGRLHEEVEEMGAETRAYFAGFSRCSAEVASWIWMISEGKTEGVPKEVRRWFGEVTSNQ